MLKESIRISDGRHVLWRCDQYEVMVTYEDQHVEVRRDEIDNLFFPQQEEI